MTRRSHDEWQRIIASWKTSRLPMKTYCRNENLNYWTFRENRKKLDEKAECTTKLFKVSPSGNIPKVKNHLTIILQGNIQVQIPDQFNEQTLAKVIKVLGGSQ